MLVTAGDVIKQPLCINPWNGGFSGGVNGKQKKPVDLAQHLRKFSAEISRSGIQMRLKHHGHMAVGPSAAHGGQQRIELRRMVGVIIDVRRFWRVQMHFHPTLHPTKLRHPLGQQLRPHFGVRGQSCRHKRVGFCNCLIRRYI